MSSPRADGKSHRGANKSKEKFKNECAAKPQSAGMLLEKEHGFKRAAEVLGRACVQELSV